MGDEIEEWKSISNYENLYEISNFGNVRSLDRYVKCSNKPNTKDLYSKYFDKLVCV